MMDTVLFTDHGIVVFAITTSAIALLLSVLGLATTHRTRSDIESQLKGLPVTGLQWQPNKAPAWRLRGTGLAALSNSRQPGHRSVSFQ